MPDETLDLNDDFENGYGAAEVRKVVMERRKAGDLMI